MINSQLLSLIVLKSLTNYDPNNANLIGPRQMTLILARHFSTNLNQIK